MAHYEPPFLQTSVDPQSQTKEVQYAQVDMDLSTQLRAYDEVPAPPIYMHGWTLNAPDYNTYWQYGMSQGFVPDQTIHWIGNHSAPDVQHAPLPYLSQLQNAANPVPTYSTVGVIGQLRSPGINEGFGT